MCFGTPVVLGSSRVLPYLFPPPLPSLSTYLALLYLSFTRRPQPALALSIAYPSLLFFLLPSLCPSRFLLPSSLSLRPCPTLFALSHQYQRTPTRDWSTTRNQHEHYAKRLLWREHQWSATLRGSTSSAVSSGSSAQHTATYQNGCSLSLSFPFPSFFSSFLNPTENPFSTVFPSLFVLFSPLLLDRLPVFLLSLLAVLLLPSLSLSLSLSHSRSLFLSLSLSPLFPFYRSSRLTFTSPFALGSLLIAYHSLTRSFLFAIIIPGTLLSAAHSHACTRTLLARSSLLPWRRVLFIRAQQFASLLAAFQSKEKRATADCLREEKEKERRDTRRGKRIGENRREEKRWDEKRRHTGTVNWRGTFRYSDASFTRDHWRWWCRWTGEASGTKAGTTTTMTTATTTTTTTTNEGTRMERRVEHGGIHGARAIEIRSTRNYGQANETELSRTTTPSVTGTTTTTVIKRTTSYGRTRTEAATRVSSSQQRGKSRSNGSQPADWSASTGRHLSSERTVRYTDTLCDLSAGLLPFRFPPLSSLPSFLPSVLPSFPPPSFSPLSSFPSRSPFRIATHVPVSVRSPRSRLPPFALGLARTRASHPTTRTTDQPTE